MKKNQGITLIALIITIIIMLILVAVTIVILINTGIIEKAQDAADETELAYQRESMLGRNINIGGNVYNDIDSYIAHLRANRELHSWHRNGDVLTCSHCNATYNIGNGVCYTSERLGTTTITAEKSGLAQQAIDYGSNSYAVTQTVRADANTEWMVLGIEDANKNGNYETLLLTTKCATQDPIALYGAAAYNNWVDECNRIAKELYGDTARGMTIDDVNECLQCFPNKSYGTSNLTTKIKDLPDWSTLPNGSTPDGSVLGDNILNGYAYRMEWDSTYGYIASPNNGGIGSSIDSSMTDASVYTIFSEAPQNYGYWLACRGINRSYNDFQFGPGFVFNYYASSYSDFYMSNGNEYGTYGTYVGFRAVIPITKDLPKIER